MIIAFAHRKRVGKDTAAKFLDTALRLERPGIKVRKVSFAAKLKDICHQLFGWAGLQPGVYYENPANESKREEVLPAIGKTPRQIWIEVGNKMREVYPDVWVDNALRSLDSSYILIVTDCRFENEVNKIHELGGVVYKITRPDAPVSDDASDCALEGFAGFDGIIVNGGTLKDLHNSINEIAKGLLDG